jgi:hypothetical protein
MVVLDLRRNADERCSKIVDAGPACDLVALVENRDVVDSQGLDIEISRKRVHPRDGAAQQQQQVSGL